MCHRTRYHSRLAEDSMRKKDTTEDEVPLGASSTRLATPAYIPPIFSPAKALITDQPLCVVAN